MLRIALTGGIATGKSYIARRLREAGVPVVDADVLARQVVEAGTPALDFIRERFGDAVIQPDGTLNRSRLADIVFRDPVARRDLEAITHPAVRSGIEAFFDALPPETAFAVADIPLLYEAAREKDFARVIVAACPPAMQMERVMAREGASREDAERRIAAQLPIEEKVERADYVVETSGSYAETDAQIEAVLQRLRSEGAPSPPSPPSRLS
jgi:dephospho-CoA kinase